LQVLLLMPVQVLLLMLMLMMILMSRPVLTMMNVVRVLAFGLKMWKWWYLLQPKWWEWSAEWLLTILVVLATPALTLMARRSLTLLVCRSLLVPKGKVLAWALCQAELCHRCRAWSSAMAMALA
jgi:hypothetical protein